jgi:predicted ribosomally synthesized peptide with SipW-like signal peptide
MKSIFLSVVIICALAISGIGGTLATWSDSETSPDNTIATGSVDLLVNGADDLPYGTGVPTKVEIEDMIPCRFYGPFEVELWDAGQHPDETTSAWIHIKKLVCDNVTPVHKSGYPDIYIPTTHPAYNDVYGDIKPEPELVAEYGGKVNCVTVPGIGTLGDDCSMATGITCAITEGPDGPDDGQLYSNVLDKFVCNELYLFELTPCTPRMIYLWFKLEQKREEAYGLDLIPDPPFDTEVDIADNNFGWDDPDYYEKCYYWQKFNDWVSWAYMKDKATFDMEFDISLLNHAGEIPPPIK